MRLRASPNPSGVMKWNAATMTKVAQYAATLAAEDPDIGLSRLLDAAQRVVLPDGPWLSPSYVANPYVWSKGLREAFTAAGVQVKGRYKRRRKRGTLLVDASLDELRSREIELLKQANRKTE